jgi:hypothetical protein
MLILQMMKDIMLQNKSCTGDSGCFAAFSKVLARPMGLPKYLTRTSLGLMAYTRHIPYYLLVA